MHQKNLTDSESLSLNIEATCLLLSSPRNFPYEIKMDKYRPYPSMISMFTSDSQHPPRSRHVVHLGDLCILINIFGGLTYFLLIFYYVISILQQMISILCTSSEQGSKTRVTLENVYFLEFTPIFPMSYGTTTPPLRRPLSTLPTDT